MKKQITASLIFVAISLVALQLTSDAIRWVFTAVLIVSLVHLIRSGFDFLSSHGKFLGFLRPWSELSIGERMFRELWMGVPLFLLAFLLSKSPIFLILGGIDVLATINRLFKQRKSEQEQEDII